MMFALLVHGYCRGQRSSRGIERDGVEDVAYRVISANHQPDHTTIARFRQRHEDEIAGSCSEVPWIACAGRAGGGADARGRWDQAARERVA
jgi:hypothetical protein